MNPVSFYCAQKKKIYIFNFPLSYLEAMEYGQMRCLQLPTLTIKSPVPLSILLSLSLVTMKAIYGRWWHKKMEGTFILELLLRGDLPREVPQPFCTAM